MSEPTAAPPHEAGRAGVILVAAGSGSRLGAGIPKAFTRLGGVELLAHGVRTVTALGGAGHLVLVIPAALAPRALALAAEHARPGGWAVSVVAGGAERHDSVLAGLDALPDGVDVVLVHDAARPLAPAALFRAVIARVRATGVSHIPALPVVDTVKRVDPTGAVLAGVDRADLVAVQTPQGFPLAVLRAAHERVTGTPTDDAAVVQAAGAPVRTIPGDHRAHKLTTPWDARLLELLLADAAAEPTPAGGTP